MQAYWHKSIYHEAMGADHAAGASGSWKEWDLLSAPDVPGDAIMAEVAATVATAADIVGVRKKGSALERKASVAIDGSAIFTVELSDPAKIIEVFATTDANVTFNVVGYVTA